MRCGFPDSTRLPGDPDGTANNPHHRHATTHTHTVHTQTALTLIAHTLAGMLIQTIGRTHGHKITLVYADGPPARGFVSVAEARA